MIYIAAGAVACTYRVVIATLGSNILARLLHGTLNAETLHIRVC